MTCVEMVPPWPAPDHPRMAFIRLALSLSASTTWSSRPPFESSREPGLTEVVGGQDRKVRRTASSTRFWAHPGTPDDPAGLSACGIPCPTTPSFCHERAD